MADSSPSLVSADAVVSEVHPRKGENALQWARRLFRCTAKQCNVMKNKPDPFVRGGPKARSEVCGFMNRREGTTGGSLVITHVAGRPKPSPELIFGTPKLAYPYVDFDTMEFRCFDKGCSPSDSSAATESQRDSVLTVEQRNRAVPVKYLLMEKWNGMNVLVFKYHDADGKVRISAKSKGAPFLTDGGYGTFLSLTLKALNLSASSGEITLDAIRTSVKAKQDPMGRGLSLLAPLLDDEVQSVTFELCGSEEPHLVKYDFALRMIPLFLTKRNGVIRPITGGGYGREEGPFEFDQQEMVARCQRYQAEMLERNEQYRREAGLRHRYEYNHFATEGMVLYLLNSRGELLGRTMYKIKPKDIEEVHWSQFDPARVREGVEKLQQRHKEMSAANLQDELDMGPKEWSRFGKQVVPYVQHLALGKIPRVSRDRRRLLLVIGRRFAGQEQVGTTLRERGWRVLNLHTGDDLSAAGRTVLEWLTVESGANCDRIANTQVVVTYTFLMFRQRKPLLAAAAAAGLLRIQALVLDYPIKVLAERAIAKTPSLVARDVRESLGKDDLQRPFTRDGFTDIFTITSEKELPSVFEQLDK
mmetsp:Transcript_3541/g.10986  ORF Transcript_3541/g.10986 Transcript_3541/m.10986 type:complete len:587 (+) Transcript_3541:75-1835(+)